MAMTDTEKALVNKEMSKLKMQIDNLESLVNTQTGVYKRMFNFLTDKIGQLTGQTKEELLNELNSH